jgi:hypothetical protein
MGEASGVQTAKGPRIHGDTRAMGCADQPG